MPRKIVVTSGPDAGRCIELDEGAEWTVGRGSASTVRLSDPHISRVHCRVKVASGSVVLSDAGSTGGTFVADQKITEHRLSVGEEIRIGQSLMRLVDDNPKSAPDSAASRPKSKRAPAMSAAALDDLCGQTLGQFRVDRIHHRGASSVLFRAHDEKHDRPAIVKVMLPSVMAGEDERSRFVRAVHTMINVRHENLVEVYGAGKQGPFCWCAMEYVDGISILEIIELVGSQGRLDWREVYRVAVHVARALQCADTHKVIHRNVTPDNLLQSKHDKTVKLCDLMLAKALEGTQAKQVTAPGQLIGNVAYMSPERMVDTSGLDWRSDQYGLGATLYALLTGQPPFPAESLPQLIQAVRNQTPAFPDDVRQETNAEFLDAVLKMLAKDPAERFTFPSLMLDRLDEIGRDFGVDADVLFSR